MAINKHLQQIYKLQVSQVKTERVYRSIGYDLAAKFDTKWKSKLRKHDLFDQKKLSKVTLKFHEAWALQHILTDFHGSEDSDFTSNLILKVINTIDQKLA